MNTGIILAAGNSSRFEPAPKQLYKIKNKPIITYSIKAMKSLDRIIIVTNSRYKKQLSKFGQIVVNDIDNRNESIKAAISHIKDADNIIIQDAARPFITNNLIAQLLESSKNYLYSQYYLKLVNGLARKHLNGYEIINRDEYIELCCPYIVDFHLFKFLFYKYISKNITCEVLPLLDKFNIKYNLIEGKTKYLRKITTIDDIY